MDIKTLIEKLGFVENLFVYTKEYKPQNYSIKIDLQKERIFYRNDEKTTVERQDDGQIQIGDHTTSNFSAPESIVVLECVNRLLEKGYAPNDLHLERKWKVGHGASGGKADINVYGKDCKTLLIIECKTWGDEFDKEKSKMEEHGGQLFTYLNQDKNTQFLVLYTSKFEKDEFVYNNLIVKIEDRDEDLKKSLKQLEEENIKLYRDAKNKGELFEVWKESFNRYFHFNGIFDEDAIAYSLRLIALKKKNLKNLDDAKGLFNKFAEILRHNNISDNANAFNRVLSLFLCKIVDEEKNEDDVLDFQVKENEEYEHIIDRLQSLYQKGMKKLNEEIIYFADKVITDIIKMYPNQTPLEELQNIFTQLKYYTNNEFAFKEVHNKKLFVQNTRVLVEVIKLLQNFKFRFTNKQQVLGDFFELMLNHGVKQSEGQFFTPIPIVRFIILSLRFDKIIKSKIANNDDDILPKILDYACGAGHFLTESIEELQQILKTSDIYNDLDTLVEKAQKKYEIELYNIYKDTLSENYKNELLKKFKISFKEKYINKIEALSKGTDWAANYIFGIEKDYRLARTSQIACYINGDGDANIIFGDGLEEHDNLKLDKKKFDVVIANPPYSVRAFRNYLNVGKTHFELFNFLTERSKEIEVLFIERTKQVLANGGLAGIVLPSTILTNTGLYSKAREVLLKHFEIKAITELGSKTFIATGTTTVILFIKRRNDDFLKDRNYIASDYFNHTQYQTNYRYIDAEKFLKMFIEHRCFDIEDYKQFLESKINERLAGTEIFKEYQNSFISTTEIKQLHTKTYFKNYSKEEKEKELNKRFYEYCKEIEKEKFLFFMLCLGDGNKNLETMEDYYKFQQTIIIKTGREIDEQKEYLGYEFVGDKGSEGLKVLNYGGKMFDETNYENPDKANSYIRKSILNIEIDSISNVQKNYIFVSNLVDLFDFNKIDFEKIIKTNSTKVNKIRSKYNLSKVINLISYLPKSQRRAGDGQDNGKFPFFSSSQIQNKWIDTVDYSEECIIIGTGGIASIHFAKDFSTSADVFVIKSIKDDLLNKFLFYFFKININLLEEGFQGVSLKHISKEYFNNIEIPIPPIEIQEKIIKEIENIEKKEIENSANIEKINSEIFEELKNTIKGKKSIKLDNICTIQSGGTPKREIAEYWNGNINWLRSEVCQNCYVYESDVDEKITESGLAKSSAKLLKPDTILIALVGATIGRVAYLTFEATTNQNVAGLYQKDINQLLPKFLFYILMNDFEKNFGEAKSKFTMANLTTIKNIEIALPSINEQKKLVAIIEAKEKEIDKLKVSLSTVNSEKEEVLKKYL